MNADMSLWSLFINASLVVQMVMGLLLLVSVVSWAMIFAKWRDLKEARSEAQTFEKRFWSGIDLVELYKQLAKRKDELDAMGALFEAGFGEYARLRKHAHVEAMDIVEGAQRAMRVVHSREMDRLDANLSFLATVGSTSPYVGLFGTVWGIMHAFQALGAVQQATLSLVAPAISEALVATAMGLFAAIPAVIAYNRFSNDVERLEGKFESFEEEFATLLQRQAHATPRVPAAGE